MNTHDTTKYVPGSYSRYLTDLDDVIAGGEKQELLNRMSTADSIRSVDFGSANIIMRKLARAGLPEAHRRLAFWYKDGSPSEEDVKLAWEHEKIAAKLGCKYAALTLALTYERRNWNGAEHNPYFAFNIVDIHPDKALFWYRRALELGIETTEFIGDLLLQGRRARDCSDDDLDEIAKNYVRAGAYAKLGRMYCIDKEDGDCTPDEIRSAREWYVRGAQKNILGYSNDPTCLEILKSWNEDQLVRRAPAKSSSLLWQVSFSPLILLFWGAVGSGLLSLMVFINSITIPLLAGGIIIYSIYKFLKSR